MTLHAADVFVVKATGAAESLPAPAGVTNRTLQLVNAGSATATWSAGGGTPFTENGVNVATITIAPGQWKTVRSNGTNWEVAAVSSSSAGASGPSPTNMPTPATVWAYDPILANTSAVLVSGRLNLTGLYLPAAATVTKAYVVTTNTGGTVTQARGGLWAHSAAGVKLADTDNIAVAMAAGAGLQTWTFTAPVSLPAGWVYFGWWVVAGTSPTFDHATGSQQALADFATAAGRYRSAVANTGLTTTAPTPLGALTAGNAVFWVALA